MGGKVAGYNVKETDGWGRWGKGSPRIASSNF
jgi:hypothetical protein